MEEQVKAVDTAELLESYRELLKTVETLPLRISGNSITFSSDLPYAALHNEGGDIRVTPRMRRFFWAKYYAARGSFGFRKDGRNNKKVEQVRIPY